METVLVTGDRGFIGEHLVDKLLMCGYKVVGYDLKDGQDIRNIQQLTKHFKKHRPSIVIHIAARTGVRKSFEKIQNYYDTNVMGTIHVLRTAQEYKVKNFIFASSSSVYGDRVKIPESEPFKEDDVLLSPASPYAATKQAGENICKSFSEMNKDMQITCLRFFTVYGENGRRDMAPYIFLSSIYHKLPFTVFGDGTQLRDFTYVGDIVDGIVLTMAKPKVEDKKFNIYNLGKGTPISINNFIKIVEWATKKKAQYMNVEKARGDVTVTFSSIEKAQKGLNYAPKITAEEGMMKMYNWFKRNH